METPKEYYYTYYSYEEWGRGYIGSRGCKYPPKEDVRYFGSYSDKSFKPKYKIILKDDYATREEAYADEIILQEYYKVAENSHFTNKSYQTSTSFYYNKPTNGGKLAVEMRVGIHTLTTEDRIINGKKFAELNRERKTGIFAQTLKQKSEAGKIGGKIAAEVNKKNGTAVYGITAEKRSQTSKRTGKKLKEEGKGIFAQTPEQRSESGRIGGLISSNQRWECTETGYIANPGNLSKYQKRNGIDTSKRKKIQ